MKRSKFEEKTMGPMFPRLHVNDTERGGPRAPPRNKMALYEQLTIPSNRHNPGNERLNPNSGTASQGTSHERVMYFPSYQTPVTRPLPSYSADRPQRHLSDALNLRSPPSQAEKRNPEDEDDFCVPIFSHSGKVQCRVAHQSRNNEERCRTFSSSCTLRLPNSCNKVTAQVNGDNLNLRQDKEGEDNEQTTVYVSSSEPTVIYSVDKSARESSDGAMQEDAVMRDHLDLNRTSRLKFSNVDNRYSDSRGPIKEAEGRISSRLRSNSPLGSSNTKEFNCEDEGNQRDESFLGENMDRGNDVSRTSNVATVSDLDVSPDDIVDVIGLKHFWKARRAIVNQQRVFAVQVFELHRLIKVQQLIAETPEVLLDASAFLGKSSIRTTPLKKIPPEYAVKALTSFNKPKDNSQKGNHNNKTEGASENAVAKTPVVSSPAPTQPLSHLSSLPAGSHQDQDQSSIKTAPEPIPPVATTNFPQGGGHQWLVPVMSPSEGLVYKPYPGPGFPGPVCGDFPPHGTTPLPGHFINPNYGVPPSHYYHHHPGAAPFNVQGYFPPYGMPSMNSALSGSSVDQINQRPGSKAYGETGRTVMGMPNFSFQQQGSCNIPSQRHSELIGSTGSSPSERAQDIVRPSRIAPKEKDALTLFPTAPISGSSGKAPQPRKKDRPTTLVPTTLVKVVPHNARTATESAARIFRSIQEERRQHQPN